MTHIPRLGADSTILLQDAEAMRKACLQLELALLEHHTVPDARQRVELFMLRCTRPSSSGSRLTQTWNSNIKDLAARLAFLSGQIDSLREGR